MLVVNWLLAKKVESAGSTPDILGHKKQTKLIPYLILINHKYLKTN